MSQDTPEFGSLFDFSEAELQANAAGRLTPHQVELLKHRRRNQMLIWLFMSAVGLFILATTYPPVAFPGSNDYFLFGMVLLIFSAAEWALVAEFRDIQADIRAGVVNTLKGRPHFYSTRNRYGETYYLSIDGNRFKLTQPQYEAIVKEKMLMKQIIQIYYTPKTQTLFSMKLVN